LFGDVVAGVEVLLDSAVAGAGSLGFLEDLGDHSGRLGGW